jgi:hypothetical protein
LLKALPEKLEVIAEAPPTILRNPQTQLSMNGKGQLEAKVDLRMTFSGPPGVSLDAKEIQHWADEDSGIANIQTDGIAKVVTPESH